MIAIFPSAGGQSKNISPVLGWNWAGRKNPAPIHGYAIAAGACGNGGFGIMFCATNGIINGISITFITIR